MDSLPVFRNAVVTVGSFDGVHRGHRYLLGLLRERAKASGGESVVVTFDRHPRTVLDASGELMLLTSLEEKARLLELEGVDNLVVLPFDERMAALSPEEFVRDVIVGRLGARELVVGYNHRFGRGRRGDAAMLRILEGVYGFRIYEAPKYVDIDGEGGEEKVSSTAIREAIARGDVETAERMLGHSV